MSDNEGAAFFCAVGEAVTAWALIDRDLFALVKSRLGAPAAQAAVVFGRTPQMAAHVALAGELLSVSLPAEHGALATWSRLAKRFEKLLPIRNMIAHQPIHYGGRAAVRMDRDEHGNGVVRLVSETPSEYAYGLSAVAQSRQRPKLPSSLSTADIRAHLKETRRLHSDLTTFRNALPPL